MNTMPASIFRCRLTNVKPHSASISRPMLLMRRSIGTRGTKRERTIVNTATTSNRALTISGKRPGPAWASVPTG